MLDDSTDDLTIAEACLGMSGLPNRFLGFSTAASLFAYLAQVKAGVEEMPALLLLDLNMPDMSGFDVLERVRGEPTFNNVPVIVALTNSDNPDDRTRVQELGADGFQTKVPDIAEYTRFFRELAADELKSGA